MAIRQTRQTATASLCQTGIVLATLLAPSAQAAPDQASADLIAKDTGIGTWTDD